MKKGGIYIRQKIMGPRRLEQGIRREMVMSMIKLFFDVGSGFFQILKKLFSRFWDRYNPLVKKLAYASCVAAFLAASVSLVSFAASSPELPHENLFSVIDVISETWNHDNPLSDVVLSSSCDDWASLTFFDGSELETGAGPQTQNRSRDLEYPVRPGETLSEIAYAYGIPYDFLAWYNKITNANRIRVGTVIIIPSIDNVEKNKTAYQQYKTKQRQTAAPVRTAKPVKNIEITHESMENGNGSGVTVHFSIVNPPSNLRSYEWDLGDGKRSFRESPSNEYSQPRTYPVRLTAQDNAGNIYKSKSL
jgi:LysM repeat protein